MYHRLCNINPCIFTKEQMGGFLFFVFPLSEADERHNDCFKCILKLSCLKRMTALQISKYKGNNFIFWEGFCVYFPCHCYVSICGLKYFYKTLYYYQLKRKGYSIIVQIFLNTKYFNSCRKLRYIIPGSNNNLHFRCCEKE